MHLHMHKYARVDTQFASFRAESLGCLQGSDDERLLYWLKACEVETRRCVLKTATKQFYFLAANHKANPPFFRDMLAPRAPLSVLCSDIIGNPEQ